MHMHRKQLHRKPYLISLHLSATVSIVWLLNGLYWTLSISTKDNQDKVSFICTFTKISSFFQTHKTIYLLSLTVPSLCNPQSNKQNNYMTVYLSFFMELSILQKKLERKVWLSNQTKIKSSKTNALRKPVVEHNIFF